MKLLDRYVGGLVLRHVGLALAALLAVFTVVNLTEELRDADHPGWGVGAALWFVVLGLPAEACTLLPAAALLGAVLALGRLASQQELTALQAGGVSPRRLAASALLAVGVVAVAGLVVGEVLAAPLSQRAHRQRALAVSGGRALSTASGVWLRDGSRFVNVGTIRPDGSLGELYVYDFDDERALERFTYARTAVPVDGRWMLEDLRESDFDGDVATTRRLAAAPWSTSIEPRILGSLWLEPRTLSLAQLRTAIRGLREQGQSALGYEVAFWQRASAPVYMGAMVLLALPLVMVGGRSVRVGERAMIGALLGLGFQMFQELFTNVGLVAALPPLVIALVPAFAALGAAAVLFRRQRHA